VLMFWSQARLPKQACVRAVLVCGLAAAMALPAVPTAAQPGAQPSTASTAANCLIQLQVANPIPGDQEVPRTLAMSGTAVDDRASSGSGISDVQVFLGPRELGGLFLGSTTVSPAAPGSWSLITNFPANASGGQDVFVYGTSSVSGQAAFVSIPIVVGGAVPSDIGVSDQSLTFCPATAMPAPVSSPTVVPTLAPVIPPTAVPTIAPAAPTPVPAVPTAVPQTPVNPPTPMPVQLAIGTFVSPPIGFDTEMLTAIAGAPVSVTFTNNTPGVPHNWHLFDGSDSNAATLAATQIITGPGTTETVSFTAPTQPGDYFFWCDVHTTLMTGTFVVTSGI
jgi:plastocyanin